MSEWLLGTRCANTEARGGWMATESNSLRLGGQKGGRGQCDFGDQEGKGTFDRVY